MERLQRLPRGIWAIGSGLKGAAEAETWSQSASQAAALTLRRPAGSGAERLAAATTLRSAGGFLATHGLGDLALAVEADAVIAGVRSLSLATYADRFPQLLRGASTHDGNEAEQALEHGAEFLIFGPVWATPEKEGILEPRGLQGLQEVVAFGAPVLAIGGIERPEQVQACLGAGSFGCAVLRAAQDPVRLAELVAASR